MGGRGASSATSAGGSPRSAADAKDLNQLSDYMGRKHGITLDASLGQLDFEAVREGVSGVDEMLDELPGLKGYISNISYRDMGNYTYACASMDGFRQYLSMSNPFRDAGAASSAISRDNAHGFHPPNTTLKGIMAHEVGHIVEYAMCRQGEQGFGALNAARKRRYATKTVGDAAKAVKKTAYGKGMKINGLISKVSGYASTNRSEAMAECIADYFTNRNKSNPLSQEVWKIAKSQFG